jgi:hypothetical protein
MLLHLYLLCGNVRKNCGVVGYITSHLVPMSLKVKCDYVKLKP